MSKGFSGIEKRVLKEIPRFRWGLSGKSLNGSGFLSDVKNV